MSRVPGLEVLIPTCGRPEALAVTLAGLANQTERGFGVLISDQTPEPGQPSIDAPAVAAMVRQLRRQGGAVQTYRRRHRYGMAEQRQFLLDRAQAPEVLCLDDDVFLEAATLGRLRRARAELGCGFVGAAPQGLSYLDDVRPGEHLPFEAVDAASIAPERVRKGRPAWERWRLHNAANLVHLADRIALPAGGSLTYRVAWVAGCVLYERAALVASGGFAFWRRLPAGHRGEDVVAQLRVLERYGGAGLLPPGAVHLELPTSVTERGTDAYAAVIEVDDLETPEARPAGPTDAPFGRGCS
ncbi:Glycosyltransferase like family 2 [Frankia sp. EI5c]|uniref:glycosyltransferase n=1 Tax=Frankia sp. EI5c TaxID=683316 RepID=UPI0007C3B415|nr:glycosyltransferase [Frankia sp. EI5c]OAA23347.1 Glycosyltransferase like family 2 [Frankia sp. EI5c]